MEPETKDKMPLTEEQRALYYHNKEFRGLANIWWCSLSINQMKEYEKQFGIHGHATTQEIAEIYDKIGRPEPQDLDGKMIKLPLHYEVRTLPPGGPWIDAGSVDEVLERAGATKHGKSRDRFRALAVGKLCVRIGFVISALDEDDTRVIAGAAAKFYQLPQLATESRI